MRAQRVVVAADGALPLLVPYYAPTVRTKRLHMIATAPIAERIVPCAIGARWGYEYFQQRPDGRIAVGGFSDQDGEGAADSYTTARGALARDPRASRARSCTTISASPAPVTHRWVGLVGLLARRARRSSGRCREHEGLYVAGGYNGTGNLNGFTAGSDPQRAARDGPERRCAPLRLRARALGCVAA